MRRRDVLLVPAVVLLPAGTLPRAGLAHAAEEAPALRGGWIASAGPAVFKGTWSAQPAPGDPNTLQGSWTMVNDAGDVLMEGTWAARKDKRGWRGSWSARVQAGGRTFTGTWEAALAGNKSFRGKTFRELLQHAGTEQIAGSWRSGPMRGHWWLKGTVKG